MKKSVYKFITVDNYEKEECFLKEMALKGWHFTHYKGLRYHFEQGESEKVDYRIDYFDGKKEEKEDYAQLFEDAGWTLVTTYPIFDGEWCYFKKEAKDKEVNEIFTDDESKIMLFKKIRYRWTMYGFLLLALIPFSLYTTLSRGTLFLSIPMMILFSSAIVLYIKLWLNLSFKIKRLQK
ncbi:DUF2812 domain-containing protein [Marinilactibacillus kalidii]|uniref:DUF2812 domain-containing protein n=1 Tax=Marinilactibacillus kalidii TaxID=2820274 RepID=UPI001ABE7BE2|nr:DUF2812 domain-containing protein [Marinilactibacillus kalidii]